ncbi:MAG: ABC transporter ATP-binding protein [Candidatus Omnitrophica bacterium]|nr:ABC transporter ATP-binding protein [Candidatus Omnitrophota bacterium]
MRNFLFLLIYKKEIVFLSLLSLISSSFVLLVPYFSKLAMDNAFLTRNFSVLLNLSFLGVAAFLFSTLIGILSDILKNKFAIKLKINLTNKFIRKLYSLDYVFFQEKSPGENVFRLFDIGSVSNFILEQCPSFIVNILKLLIILGICFCVSFKMTISLVILGPLLFLCSLYFQKRIRPIYEEIWKYNAKISKEIYEAFSKISIVKAFGWEVYQRHNYLRSLIGSIRWQIKSFRWAIIGQIGSSFFSKAVYGVIAFYGGWLIIRGKITIGGYAAVMLYFGQLAGILGSFSGRFSSFVQETVSLRRFFEVIDFQPEIKDLPDAKIIQNIKGNVAFNNVEFRFQNEKVIFNKLNLVIPASSWVGIVGPSGCGKTTLINLILRLYEPQAGKIIIDGVDLKAIKLKSLRDHIAVATQQPYLFDLSIKENIVYGLKNISQDQIVQAARDSCVHDFIEQLPKGE